MDPIDVAKRYISAWTPDLSTEAAVRVLDELIASDAIFHTFIPAKPQLSKSEFLMAFSDMKNAMPNMQKTASEYACSGDIVYLKYSFRGDFTGAALYGFKATQKPLELFGLIQFRVVDGKIIRAESLLDVMSTAKQLGLDLWSYFKPSSGLLDTVAASTKSAVQAVSSAMANMLPEKHQSATAPHK